MQGIHKRFGATYALRGVDLEVEPGEIHALIGENGAGKSTLMKVLSGAHAPDRGRMWIDGDPYIPGNPLHARQSGVAMIYQELSLAPHLSVMENILLGIEPTTGPFVRWSEMRRRAAQALEEVGVDDIPPDVQVRSLPLARQQLVEIARAVALKSRVLVLDEPTSSLTQQDIDKLFALIRRLKQAGLAIVYISHFLEEVQAISDRYTVLRDGLTVGGGDTTAASVHEIVSLMVGREIEDLYPRSDRKTGEVLLTIRSVEGRAKPTSASFELRRGEILGISGLAGAGRTELIRAVFGLDEVVAGDVKIGAYEGPLSPGRSWRERAGMVSEDRKREGLATGLSIADNITLPRLGGLGPIGLVVPSRQDAVCRPWIARLGLKCQSPRQPVHALSGGNQQKVAIARLLHADVDVLLLDEPTRGIDVGSKAEIYRQIDELAAGDRQARRPPKAVLLVSSYLPELLGVCDRIAVMSRGRLTPPRPVADWDEHRLMLAATGQEHAA